MDVEYGLSHDDILKAICNKADEYRTALGLNTISGFLKQGIKQDIFDTIFLNTPDDPWSTILMNKQERYAETHLIRSRTAEFMINNVYEYTGLGLDEFLKLPTYLVEHILSTLRQMNSSTRTESKKLEREIERETNFTQLKKERRWDPSGSLYLFAPHKERGETEVSPLDPSLAVTDHATNSNLDFE